MEWKLQIQHPEGTALLPRDVPNATIDGETTVDQLRQLICDAVPGLSGKTFSCLSGFPPRALQSDGSTPISQLLSSGDRLTVRPAQGATPSPKKTKPKAKPKAKAATMSSPTKRTTSVGALQSAMATSAGGGAASGVNDEDFNPSDATHGDGDSGDECVQQTVEGRQTRTKAKVIARQDYKKLYDESYGLLDAEQKKKRRRTAPQRINTVGNVTSLGAARSPPRPSPKVSISSDGEIRQVVKKPRARRIKQFQSREELEAMLIESLSKGRIQKTDPTTSFLRDAAQGALRRQVELTKANHRFASGFGKTYMREDLLEADSGPAFMRIKYPTGSRSWGEDVVQFIGQPQLRFIVTMLVHSTVETNNDSLRPERAALVSPRIFWNMTIHYGGVLEGLKIFFPDRDWSHLTKRERVLSEKAREAIENGSGTSQPRQQQLSTDASTPQSTQNPPLTSPEPEPSAIQSATSQTQPSPVQPQPTTAKFSTALPQTAAQPTSTQPSTTDSTISSSTPDAQQPTQVNQSRGTNESTTGSDGFAFSFDDEHNDVCEKCEQGGDLLLCDGCNLAFHLKCHTPPMEEVPEDDWYCMYCARDSMVTRPPQHSTPSHREQPNET